MAIINGYNLVFNYHTIVLKWSKIGLKKPKPNSKFDQNQVMNFIQIRSQFC